MTRFAENVSTDEIKNRIVALMETREFKELELLLAELNYRRKMFRRRILLEMSEIGELMGMEATT